MKNLLSALLITTFAVASSFAAQDRPQAGFKAPPLVESSSETIAEGELWYKKHHHHQKTCRNKIITLPFPVCDNECKFKCKDGERECDEGCDSVDQVCSEECRDYEGTCKTECKEQKRECKTECQGNKVPCDDKCGLLVINLCLSIIGGTDAGDQAHCHEVFDTVPLTGNNCNDRCETAFGVGTTDDAQCEIFCTFYDECKTDCGTIEETCEGACETCDGDCDKACQDGKKVCGAACDSGKDWCKGKCEHSEHECHENCKPCTFECERACHEDEEWCLSYCKENQGLDKDCRNKCSRDCDHVCERRCQHCNTDTDEDLTAGNAPDKDLTIPTISTQQKPIVPVPFGL